MGMTMKKFSLKYGQGEVTFELPQDQLLYELVGRNQPPPADLEKAYRQALDHPLDSPPLRELVKPGDKVAITVSDITRAWQRNAETLPFVAASFDGVLLKDVLEHFYLEEAFRVLQEVSRILKTDGRLVVTTTKDTQSFWDKPDHVRPYSNKWVRRVLVQELGQYELIAARELSGGIRGFGKLHLEWLAHVFADQFGIRNTHGIIALRKI